MNMKNMSRQLSAVIFVCMTGSSGAYGAVLKLPGTGFDAAGNALTSGDVDANWSLSGGYSGTNKAYLIAPGSPNWWQGGAFNQYIANTNTASFNGSGWISNNAASNYNGPAPYTFSMHFDLTGFDLSTVSITGLWAIANAGILELNGNLVEALPSVETSNWDSLHSYSITNTNWLNPGINTISLTITNSNETYEAARLEGEVTGSQKGIGASIPEPATSALFCISLASMGLARLRNRKGF